MIALWSFVVVWVVSAACAVTGSVLEDWALGMVGILGMLGSILVLVASDEHGPR